jgi:amino acid adenylation domain-containing protein
MPVSVLEQFAQQVATAPDAVAVQESDRYLTYATLSERAECIARRLGLEGVTGGQIVGLMLPRSIDAVVAMLGILKAGAAYLPIDPKYPLARTAYMLRNSGARVVVTSVDLERERGATIGNDLRYLDVVTAATFAGESTASFAATDPDSLAYVIYTSGSTGTPKGVQIPHRGFQHYVTWAKQYYVAGKAVDMPLFSSLAFDLTITSIYLPLVTGGRVVVYREEGGPRDLAIYSVIKDDRVDIIKLTPSHLALVARMDLNASRVRTLIVGGEDLKASLAIRVHRAFGGGVAIVNEYGPTEATVGCMEYRFDPARDVTGSVPIGRAIAGAEILVLNEQGQAAAPGGTGEIFIGGPGLALGYVNQPEATRDRFVPHPTVKERTVYRTGDVARVREDGNLEFVGRADRQIKIGSVRIELGEVESALQEHAGVRAAAVTLFRPRTASEEIFHCTRCALPSNYPGVTYDSDGLCHVCRDYDRYKDQAASYFGSMAELRQIFVEAKATRQGDYDCLVLFSGGKDSSYVLYQLLAMDLKVLAYTLDNGYISASAKDNIRRTVTALGVDHVFGSTAAMDGIFRKSLEQFSNVCNGCFKTLYTLSMRLAHEKRIKYIVTGLSRGQLFETRLDFLFRNRVFDITEIERDVQRARRVYHAQRDLVATSLGGAPLAVIEPALLESIQFVDFYRYSGATRQEIMDFLEGANWTRPADTGRSTNCLINDVGIFIHNRERGFHNYALPYCWDVRLGLLDRDEALRELSLDVNMSNVKDILHRVAYESTHEFRSDEPRLTAYYASEQDLPAEQLRSHLGARLPASMVPAHFVRLPEIPLTVNGKVDWDALPAPSPARVHHAAAAAPRDELERTIAAIWERLLGTGRFGVRDRFFDVGGTSMLAVLLHLELEDLVDSELPDPGRVEGWTIAEQAELLRGHGYGDPVIVAPSDRAPGPSESP